MSLASNPYQRAGSGIRWGFYEQSPDPKTWRRCRACPNWIESPNPRATYCKHPLCQAARQRGEQRRRRARQALERETRES